MSELRESYWDLVADKIQRQPELLDVARENIERWLSQGHSAPHRLREWEVLLEAAAQEVGGFSRLLLVLRGTDPISQRLRDFDPFPGILTREERRRARELCGYRH